jgi:hypothetical protein
MGLIGPIDLSGRCLRLLPIVFSGRMWRAWWGFVCGFLAWGLIVWVLLWPGGGPLLVLVGVGSRLGVWGLSGHGPRVIGRWSVLLLPILCRNGHVPVLLTVGVPQVLAEGAAHVLAGGLRGAPSGIFVLDMAVREPLVSAWLRSGLLLLRLHCNGRCAVGWRDACVPPLVGSL